MSAYADVTVMQRFEGTDETVYQDTETVGDFSGYLEAFLDLVASALDIATSGSIEVKVQTANKNEAGYYHDIVTLKTFTDDSNTLPDHTPGWLNCVDDNDTKRPGFGRYLRVAVTFTGACSIVLALNGIFKP